MKFKIDKNKLREIVFKYVDKKDLFIKETSENYFFIKSKNATYAHIVVDKYNMNCYILSDFFEEIELFFSITPTMVKNFLKKYVQDKLNVKVSYIERGHSNLEIYDNDDDDYDENYTGWDDPVY